MQLTALKTAAGPIANPWFEVVGVVSDIKNEGTLKDVSPEVYLPYTIEGFGSYHVFLRTGGKPEGMIPELTSTAARALRREGPCSLPSERHGGIDAHRSPRWRIDGSHCDGKE